MRKRQRHEYILSAATRCPSAAQTTTLLACMLLQQAAAQCFTISNSAVAPEYNGYQINARLMNDPFSQSATTTSFDQYLASVNDAYSGYQSKFKNAFACPNWSGFGQRFHLSYFTALLISLSSPPSPAACMQPSTALPLCRDTCAAALIALGAIFNDPNQCGTTDPSGNRGPTMKSYNDYCNSLTVVNTASGKCLPGLGFELSSCGFANPANLAQYCSSSDGISDPCCSTAGTPVDFMNPSSIASVNVTGMLNKASSAAAIAKSATASPSNNSVVIGGMMILNSTMKLADTGNVTKSMPSTQNSLSSKPGFIFAVVVITLVAAAVVVALVVLIFRKQTRKWMRRNSNDKSNDDDNSGAMSSAFILTFRKLFKRSVAPESNKNGDNKFGRGFGVVDSQHSITNGQLVNRSRSQSDPAPDDSRISISMQSSSIQTNDQTYVVHNSSRPTHSQNASTNRMHPQSNDADSDQDVSYAGSSQTHLQHPSGSKLQQTSSDMHTLSTGSRRALYNYEPKLSDELGISAGDPIHIEAVYDDGWASGYNHATQKHGVFPIACVEQASFSMNSVRHESMQFSGATIESFI